jgi:hypothetical protein
MQRRDNLSKFYELRSKFPFLSYDSYEYHFDGDLLRIRYSFNLSDTYSFRPSVEIPIKKGLMQPVGMLSRDATDNLVFHCGMIELISYWKSACPPRVIVKPHFLNRDQVGFWKKVYYQGLGEFFFLNSIDTGEEDFMELTSEGHDTTKPLIHDTMQGSIVPVGGGKDSAVTMGLLNHSGENWIPFVINPGKTSREMIAAAGKAEGQTVEFKREIHPLLLQLNEQGFLNGHTPFSALLAFYSLLAAFLTGRGEIILSNESSANESTVPGTLINHQYSKSLEFESDFRKYVRDHISPDFNYFSLLRPLSELQIAGIFSEMPEFHALFRSCNAGSKTNSWCCHCPKCLFTFIILSPFLRPEILSGIFGKNLLDDSSLEHTFRQLAGHEEYKPFECIGTVDEVNYAITKAFDFYPAERLPYLLKVYRNLPQNPSQILRTDISRPAQAASHFVPEKYLSMLENLMDD